MTFETMDWELEAKRVRAAFAVIQPCEFAPFHQPGMNFIPSQLTTAYDEKPISIHGTTICVRYTPEMRYYSCIDCSLGDGMAIGESEITFDWKGNTSDVYVENSTHGARTCAELVQGLSLLGLLTPEVEAALGVSASAHEKLEWEQRYAHAMEFGLMDWDAEALRVARAFGVEGSCIFEQMHDDVVELRREETSEERDILLAGKPLLCLIVDYSHKEKAFGLTNGYLRLATGYRPDTTLHLKWDGSVAAPTESFEFAELLAKGLFHLGLLTPEVETALRVSISENQKRDWAREFEKRYEL